ncbi:MAG: ATP-binding protein [Bacillota bacterium]
MGGNIFQRLLFTYAAVLIIAVLLLAALLTFFFNIFLFNQKTNQLITTGRSLQSLSQDFFAGKMSRDELERTGNTMGMITDSQIFMLDEQKMSLLKFQDQQVFNAGDIKTILDGGIITRKEQYSNQMNGYFAFVGMPLYNGDKVTGAILLLSPQEQANKTLTQIYKIIWGTTGVSMVIASVFIYILSVKISRPVENIQKAAAAIAEGRFTDDLKPSGSDEVAQLTKTFNYMKNRLMQIEEMRKDLIANVSHELRTPLTSISGFILGILDGVIPPGEQEKYLRLAYEETARLNRLVNDLLQLARIQTGNISLNREKIDVGDFLREIAEENSLATARRNIALTSASPDGVLIYADRDRLKQILINLLHNAINYSGEGGEISIQAQKTGDSLMVTVSDSGPGIPEDQLDLIFEKFYRVEKSRSREIPGTGLGLSIARELVELHGGKIYARNKPGRGTDMIFEIPLGTEQPGDDQ